MLQHHLEAIIFGGLWLPVIWMPPSTSIVASA
jgi:hypothetical protein